MRLCHKRRICASIVAVSVSVLVALTIGGATPASAASSSAAARSASPVVLDASWSFIDSVGWAAEVIGAVREAKKLGITLHVESANGSTSTQASQVQTFLVNHPSGVILSPVDAKAGSALVKTLNGVKIPVGNVDSHVTAGGQLATDVESNNVDCGMNQGKLMVKLAHGKQLHVLMVDGFSGSTAATQREQGFLKAIKGHRNIKVVARAYGAWSGQQSEQAVLDAFQAHPEINAIFNTSDVNTVGTVPALRQLHKLYPAGNPKHIIMTSNDGFPYGLNFIRKGWVDGSGTQQLLLMGKTEVDNMVLAAEGKPVPHRVNFLSSLLVTKKNVNKPNLWGNVMAKWKPSDGYTVPK